MLNAHKYAGMVKFLSICEPFMNFERLEDFCTIAVKFLHMRTVIEVAFHLLDVEI